MLYNVCCVLDAPAVLMSGMPYSLTLRSHACLTALQYRIGNDPLQLLNLVVQQVAPTHLRGTLGSVNQLVICFGILGALVCNILIPATQWRLIFALTGIPAALPFLGMPWLPVCLDPKCTLFGPAQRTDVLASCQ